MARKFVRASSQYLELAAAVLTATPFTMSAWFNTSSATTVQGIVGLNASANTTNYFRLDVDAANKVRMGTSGTFTSTSTTFSVGTWNHAAFVSIASNSRAVYLNGAGKATNTSGVTPSGLNLTDVGCDGGSSRSNYFNGSIAEVGIWNVALTDQEVSALAAGALPHTVRPGKLVAYWPLWGLHSPEIDLSGSAQNMVITGATAANHAPVTLFTRKARTPVDVASGVYDPGASGFPWLESPEPPRGRQLVASY